VCYTGRQWYLKFWGATIISPQNDSDKLNTQTGHLNPRTLLHRRYVIMRAIGQGGMAAVYQARDTKKGTLCAIKEMSLSTVTPDEKQQAVQNFLAEARILSRLNHPNLPAFTDFFTEDFRHYLVMEFIDGNTLEELLDRNNGPFSERRVLSWARQLCDVLEYLHSQQPPVIFRDLKPGNIMLARNGRIKLIDFGIARLFRSTGSQDTQLLGTPGYAPPEQYGSAQTDERSDIYSLAMTLFQLMTCSISESGFGLTNVHKNYPQISPPVARALEKATALNPDDRYQSVEVFKRALLGVGTFRFENGGEATTPEELADLCARYPEEAADYLFSGEIEAWLQEIGESDLSRTARRLRNTIGDPTLGVNKFLQAVMGPSAHIRTGTATVTQTAAGQNGSGSRLTIPGSRASRAGRTSPDAGAIVVRPRAIDFGEVYPGLSAPMLLTISGVKGALVSGSIKAVESWIILDQTHFDGLSTPVRVRVDTTRLRGSTHYTGTIIVQPDESEREISVKVEVDVLGFVTNTMPARPAGNPTGMPALDDDEDDDLVATGSTIVSANGSRMTMASPTASQTGTTITANQPFTNARYDEFKEKYGPPGQGGWQRVQTSQRQDRWLGFAMTFTAAFMLGAFFYLFLAHLPPLAHTPVLTTPWFILILIGMLLFSTLGAVLVNWRSHWSNRDTLNRIITGLLVSLLVLGLIQVIWQNLNLANPPLQLFVLLLFTAAGATAGTSTRVSEAILRGVFWLFTRASWLAYTLAVIVCGSIGYTLTSGFSYGCFAPFGALFGAGIGVALVLRVRRLLQQRAQSPNVP